MVVALLKFNYFSKIYNPTETQYLRKKLSVKQNQLT